MPRFVKPVLWTIGVLAAGGLAFWLLLALNIPYQSTAAPETTPGTTSATTPVPPPVPPPAPPAERTAWIADVRPGPDDHSAVLHVTLPTCAEGAHTQVTETGTRIDAGVLFRVRPDPDCQEFPADFPIRTAAPIGKRMVVVNSTESWGLRSGGWKKCDWAVNCDPPPDHCDPAWIGQLEFSAEAEFPGTTRACDQNWLIHDLQRHSGQRPTRVAYRWAGNGWSSVGGATGGGCAEILSTEPKFPTALCKDLAPPG
ncbi:hypothetical protein [Amycolatopsis rifamycinica]|uniref:Uncharacterized protein n=1 Tax=Amycolatopsis rifamycinica TaxID=287986 RepID=A0A066U3V3_9PSEU|nr:hypothetical protein [Amycolatopsis rifamycinica]KDN18789.1 hypothetical protein DV20_29820 [Amycolatopsis rifamycinica]